MLLLDVGNTNIKSYENGKIHSYAVYGFKYPKEKFYYICVNPEIKEKLIVLKNAINLEDKFLFKSDYKGLGVDRVAACYTVNDGVVVDAGSAITVDLMRKGAHLGGFIMPGLSSYKDSFANISSKLILNLDQNIRFEEIPANTNEALVYGVIKPVICAIEEFAKEKKIVVTGGDGKKLCRYLKNSVYDEELVFKGMKKVIKEREC